MSSQQRRFNVFCKTLDFIFLLCYILLGKGERMRRRGRKLRAKACSALARPFLFFARIREN